MKTGALSPGVQEGFLFLCGGNKGQSSDALGMKNGNPGCLFRTKDKP